MSEYTAYSIEEAVALCQQHDEDGSRVVDPDGDELFPDGEGGVMYEDGANAVAYGPLSGK